MTEEEKPGQTPETEDRANESTSEKDRRPDAENQLSEEECDEVIAGLLATIEQLRTEISQLREQLAVHESAYEHHHGRGPEQAAVDGRPDERHIWFRRVGRE